MNLDNLETRTSTGGQKKLFTGIANLKIVSINPTREQIAEFYEAADLEKVKEPNYFHEDSTRLDFYYKNHDSINMEFKGKFSLFISNEPRVSQSGKKQYIDAHSKTCWATSLGDLSEINSRLKDFNRLKLNKVREAKRGEETLYSLLKAYSNVDTNTSEFVLDSYESLVKGQVKELTEFFQHYNVKFNGGVKVLMGIKEGQYQDIWTNLFMNVNAKISEYLKNRITDADYGYKHFYGGSFVFKEFIPTDEPKEVESSSDLDDPFSDSPSTTSSAPTSNSDDGFDVDDLFG